MSLADASSGDGRCLIVPSDFLVREFDAKLLFACAAAERGFSAIVGSKYEMHRRIGEWPRSLYIHKDVHSWPKVLQRLRRLGHRVLAWDEEGLVNVSPERYIQMRVSGEVLGTAEALFAWGDENAEAWQHSSVYPGTPIHVTGNPRGDLMRPELRAYFDDDVAALRRRFGDFILINTNFGFVNHLRTKSTRIDIAEWRERAGKQDGFMDGFVAFRGQIFQHFLAMVPRLAEAFPHRTIVVRPHPIEHPDAWREAAAGRANVQVLHEGNAMPWLLAAEVTIHNGCSTGLESYLLGRPAVAYRPLKSDRYDIPLPNAVSHEATSLEALIAAVEAAGAGALTPTAAEVAERRRVVDHNIAALDRTLASDRIADIVRTIAADDTRPRSPVRRGLDRLADAALRLAGRRWNRDTDKASLQDHKFPPTPVAAVEDRIDRLRRILGRFHDIGVRELAPKIFEVARR